MKKTKEEFMRETESLLFDDTAIIEMYEKVLYGEMKQFPRFFWELPNRLYYAKVILRYLLDVEYNWSIEDIKEQFTLQILFENKLQRMYTTLSLSHYELLNNAYPNKFHPWELKSGVPKGFWRCDENKRNVLKWLFEEKLNGDTSKISWNAFEQNNLLTLLCKYFKSNPQKAIEFAYNDTVNA